MASESIHHVLTESTTKHDSSISEWDIPLFFFFFFFWIVRAFFLLVAFLAIDETFAFVGFKDLYFKLDYESPQILSQLN